MYMRILTVQDISCVGQCSMTVALPILSACGFETCILPSAVLSTHTGGFEGFTVRDLSEDFPAIIDHWEKEKINFDAVYTGYLGNMDHVRHVIRIANTLKTHGGKMIVDPAMADGGKLYYGFDGDYVNAMRELCTKADIILPNITEACLLAGEDYTENYDTEFISNLLKKLYQRLGCTVVLTGVSYREDETGIAIYDGDFEQYYRHKRISQNFHGTGDIYSSVFVGVYLNERDIYKAVKTAADFTLRCIENTVGDDKHWYGVKFEPVLPQLINSLNKI